MKFIHYLEKISDVSIYGLTSFMIFFIFFCAVLTWVWKSDKKQMKKMSELPLD